MLQFKFKGPWKKVRRELQDHEAEIEGHEVELTVAETQHGLEPQSDNRTLAERFKGRTGRIAFDGPSAKDVKKVFGEILEEKYRDGHL